MNAKTKMAICGVVLVLLTGLWWMQGRHSAATVSYSQFLERVRGGQVAGAVVMAGNTGATEAICRLRDGRTVRTVLPSQYRDALAVMQDNHVDVEIRDASGGVLPIVGKALPFLLLLGVWVFLMMRKFPNGTCNPFRAN